MKKAEPYKNIIILGKETVAHILYDGFSVPSIDQMAGRVVSRAGKNYMCFPGEEIFQPFDPEMINEKLRKLRHNLKKNLDTRALKSWAKCRHS